MGGGYNPWPLPGHATAPEFLQRDGGWDSKQKSFFDDREARASR